MPAVVRPLVDLDLRLGEGTGAVLAFPIVECAGAVLREMATFDSAGVSERARNTEHSIALTITSENWR